MEEHKVQVNQTFQTKMQKKIKKKTKTKIKK